MNMKKIFLLFAAVGVLFACDPTHEKIDNGGHITLEELLAKTTVKTDIAPNGKPGNVITCETLAPVNAVWEIDGKAFVSTYAKKKMKKGEHAVKLTALCADGTKLENTWIGILCEEITDPLQKIYIYGDPEKPEQGPVTLPLTTPAAGRFSDNEGSYFPYLADEVYYGLETLVFEVTDVQEGENPNWGMPWGPALLRVMTGWWSPQFMDDFTPEVGLMEIPITQEMAEWCAHTNKEDADGNARNRDLTLMMTRGSMTIKSVYYEK